MQNLMKGVQAQVATIASNAGGNAQPEMMNPQMMQQSLAQEQAAAAAEAKAAANVEGLDPRTAEIITLYKQAFDVFDKNGNGSISAKELNLAIRALKLDVTDAQIKDMVEAGDVNKSGDIEFEEFLYLIGTLYGEKEKKLIADGFAERVFKIFDRDGNGLIPVPAMRQVLASVQGDAALTEEEQDRFIREADPDDDQTISYKMFVQRLSEM
eukprot:TRINITY_DN3646_c0_g1_i3.p1 TRINITY_DN3646_c0_g1~~TRINITY_DN3646_c0_g1_i3.p1  ORF type:complete len:211 (+),score=59.71 TRINITY_DN3646_c0_g1_i3:175-807(+)